MSDHHISYSSIETQRQLRIEKTNKLREIGHDPFTPNSKRDDTLANIKADFETKKGQTVTLVGRIKSKRMSGKIAFATVEDESLPEGFQFIFKQDELPTEENPDNRLTFNQFKELFDEGDYIQGTGKLEVSQRGEPSLFVEQYEILTKALRPLPEKMEYENFEIRYLDRVADFKMNTKDPNGLAVRDMIKLKAKYWQIWREELLKEGFDEVECPVFEAVPGGAEAKPFTTYYNELEQEVYLRISLELPLKKLIAGGFEKVFEIGRIFRNEGASPQHLQEYTQIEWYWSYKNYHDVMPFTVRVYRRLALEILGSLKQTDYYGNEINWGEWCDPQTANDHNWKLINGWPAIPYFEAIRYFSNNTVDLEGKTHKQLLQIAAEHKIETEPNTGYSTLLDKIYKKVARPNIVNPIFLTEQPIEIEPLAKKDLDNPKLVHRWQIVVGTAEMGKCFSELNDPIDQHNRFKEQQKARDKGDEEAQFMDENYVKALEYGTPPMAGFGVSERHFSFLLGKHIKEAVTFPAIRSTENIPGKTKHTMVAHAVILNTPEIPTWTKLNTAAHLSAAFGARKGKQLIHINQSTTSDGDTIPMNIQHAILIKETIDNFKLLELKKAAEAANLDYSVFTEQMKLSSNDEKVRDLQENKSSYEINYLGVLVFGKKSDVEKLTEDFKMFE